MNKTVEAGTRPSFHILAIGCGIGTALTYFNFVIYGTAAVLIFNEIFFANNDPWFGTFLALVTLAVGFMAGPIGAILFGHFGDRIGRRQMLQISLATMAVTSLLIALLPTYAAIGVAAPVMLVLLRVVDGMAAGGELGGAAVLIFEHAPADKRGRYGSMVTGGANVAAFVAYGFFTLLALLPRGDRRNDRRRRLHDVHVPDQHRMSAGTARNAPSVRVRVRSRSGPR